MKNCPMFSLRSNSIELRFRSVRRGNFLVYAGSKSNIEKNNVKNNPKNGFATLIKAFLLAMLDLGTYFFIWLIVFIILILKKQFFRGLRREFCMFTR